MGIRPQSQGSQHAKPFVAPKPANLSTTAPSHIAPPPIPPSVPLKPQILRRPSGGRPMPGKSSSGSGGRVPTLASLGPGPAPGTASGNAGGLRRASTIGGGRSESSLPAPQAQMRYSPPSSTSPIPPSGATSRSSSPEKQQPVNVLIARWNKGQV
jgi:AP2-associated kinase